MEQQKKEASEKEDKAIYERLKKRQLNEEAEKKEEEELELARQVFLSLQSAPLFFFRLLSDYDRNERKKNWKFITLSKVNSQLKRLGIWLIVFFFLKVILKSLLMKLRFVSNILF